MKKCLETLGLPAERSSSPSAENRMFGALCLMKGCCWPDIKRFTTCFHLAADLDGIFSS